jgi:hypothetical protein
MGARPTIPASIPDNVFAFRNLKFKSEGEYKGCPLYPLTVYCQVCGDRRFTDEQIGELSSTDLTLDAFSAKYPHLEYANKSICQKRECENGLHAITGGFNTHMLKRSFY